MSVWLKADDSESFKTMVQFECRGLEPVDFQPQVRESLKTDVSMTVCADTKQRKSDVSVS